MDHCPEHSAHERAIREHDGQLAQLGAINETLAALRVIERQNQERIDAMGERIDALEPVHHRRARNERRHDGPGQRCFVEQRALINRIH